VVGFGLGGGSINAADDSFGGFAFNFEIGGVINQQLAVVFDYSSIAHRVNQFADTLNHSIWAGAAQVFFLRFLWAKAGLGLGRLSVSDAYGTEFLGSRISVAMLAAVGAEVLQTTGGFALDIQLRVAGASYGDAAVANTSLMVGFNFY
jgi:hypothetical protein